METQDISYYNNTTCKKRNVVVALCNALAALSSLIMLYPITNHFEVLCNTLTTIMAVWTYGMEANYQSVAWNVCKSPS